MDNWGLQLVRLVLFKSDVSLFKAGSLYTQFTGEDPDHLQNNRTPNPAAPFLSLAVGEVKDAANQVVVEPGRVMFEVACPDRANAGPWAWRLRDGIERADDAIGRLTPLFPHFGAFDRLAVHINLLRNVGTAAEAGQFFAEHVEVEAIPDALDLIYQFNRRSTSKFHKQQLNRLVRFSTSSIQELQMTIQDGVPLSQVATPARHLASLLIDVNTMPGTRFDNEVAWKQLAELYAEAVRIAEIGTPSALKG